MNITDLDEVNSEREKSPGVPGVPVEIKAHREYVPVRLPSGLEFHVPSHMFERVLPKILEDNPHDFLVSDGYDPGKLKRLTAPLICSTIAWTCIALTGAIFVGLKMYTSL
jgi:hypothetical protein